MESDRSRRVTTRTPQSTVHRGFRSARADMLVMLAGWATTFVVLLAFGWILFDLSRLGASNVSWSLISQPPRDAGRAGGISTILVATVLVLVVCCVAAVPSGIATAVWLSEFARPNARLSRLIQGSLDLLASVPSIVFGLFGMVLFGRILNLGLSILSGGLTLACMVLPVVIQSVYEGLRSVPDSMRRSAAALGMTKRAMLRHLLFPAAIHGLTVGLILGIGRALAETAALIFTSGYVTRMPESLLDSGRTLSVHIYDLAMNVPGGEARAGASALVLLLVLLMINLAAASLARVWRLRV